MINYVNMMNEEKKKQTIKAYCTEAIAAADFHSAAAEASGGLQFNGGGHCPQNERRPFEDTDSVTSNERLCPFHCPYSSTL